MARPWKTRAGCQEEFGQNVEETIVLELRWDWRDGCLSQSIDYCTCQIHVVLASMDF